MGPIDAFKIFLMIRKDIKNAKLEVLMDNVAKPGWKTTEFWITIAMQVPTVLGIFIGVSNPITVGIGAAAGIAYTLSRAWSKSNGAAVALAALQAGADAAKALPAPKA